MKKCVFAGTFDPVTIGHKDIVEKCLHMFDQVVVAILINPNKGSMFALADRIALLQKVFGGYKNVKIVSFDGLLVDLLKKEQTMFYVRGIRNSTDYEYETVMNYTNTERLKGLTTIFLPTSQEHLHVSSSLVRELIKFGAAVDTYLPEEIKSDIKKLIKKGSK